MLNPEKSFSIKKFSLTHTLKIFVIYWSCILFYNSLYFLMEVSNITYLSFKEEVLIKTLYFEGYHIGHLWFLPALICLYLLTPLLRKAFMDEHTCLYMLLLFFFFGVFVHTALKFDFPYRTTVFYFTERIPMDLFLGYAGYYSFGHYITYFSKKPSKIQFSYLWILTVSGYLFTTLGCYFNSQHINEATSVFNEPFSVGQFLTATSLYALCIHILRDHKPPKKVLIAISNLTFPVYLFHPAIILLLKKRNYPFFFASSILAIPIDVLVVFLLSCFLSAIFYFPYRKLRYHCKNS